MDDGTADSAHVARSVPLPENRRVDWSSSFSWPGTWRMQQDPEAQSSHWFSSRRSWMVRDEQKTYAGSPSYIEAFLREIKQRLQHIVGRGSSPDNSKQEAWVDAKFKDLRNKYTRQRQLGPDPSKISPTFEGSITYIPKKPTNGDCVQPYTQPLILGDSTTIKNSLDKAKDRWDSENRLPPGDSSQPSALRWIHLPANNMQWVESAMSSVIATCQPVRDNLLLQKADWDSMADRVLAREFWRDQCGRNLRNPIFSRVMKPFADHIKVVPDGHSSQSSGESINFLVAFMPYLHWESSIVARYMEHVVEDIRRGFGRIPGNETTPLNKYMCQDELLLRSYLSSGGSSIQPRRTLDQFYYPYLKDTRDRDYDQVIERYALKGHFDSDTFFDSEPPILMVDQCWVWAIGSDTILSAFPKTWDCNGQYWDPLDLQKTILRNIRESKHQHYLESSSYFARLIIRISAVNLLQPAKQFQEHDKFLLYFGHAIGELRQRKTKYLKRLLRSLPEQDDGKKMDEISNVKEEYQMLEEAHDLIEELQMIRHLLSDQDVTMRRFAQAQYKFEKKFDESRHNRSKQYEPAQRFKMLHRPAIKERRKLVNQFYQEANDLNVDINQLLSLKQRQATISEAQQGGEQGKTLMLFTIVTIIFLPLSTLAAIFGINSENFGSGSMKLSTIFAYIFPISFMCVVLSLAIGLKHEECRNLLRAFFGPVKLIYGYWHFCYSFWFGANKMSAAEDESEVLSDSIGLTPQSSAGRAAGRTTTGSSHLSAYSNNQRHSTRSHQGNAQSSVAMERLTTSKSPPEQATSVLRRNDRSESHSRRRSSRRRNSRNIGIPQVPWDEEDTALYSFSSFDDEMNSSANPESDMAGSEASIESARASGPRVKQRGKQVTPSARSRR